MSQIKVYLAIDLGAGSGRVVAGEFDGRHIELHELNRFENVGLELPTGSHCNLPALYQNILDGLRIAADRYGEAVVSLGIDTWGVDYGLLDKDGRLIGLPYFYRDSRTQSMMEKAEQIVPKKTIYEATGIQFIFFNSLYQLLSEVEGKNPGLHVAEDLLFMPDLLGYWLTGKKVQERSIASTSQLYNPTKKSWDYNLIEKFGLPKHLFKELSDPGGVLGGLRDKVARRTGLKGAKVITVAGHDTASAVAAVPSQSPTPAYLSSGTWSLLGLELPEPVVNQQSFEDGFTNEIGVGNTVRFLKNICGLWLIQQSRRYWRAAGEDVAYSRMGTFAAEAKPFRSFIDPDSPLFVEEGCMPEKIQQYCTTTGQPVPETKGQIIRCIYESLALRYAEVWQKLVQYTDTPPETLHIVGGGCQDKLLNQFTANALGVKAAASPVEATSLGNILVQMMSDGVIRDLQHGREIVLNSSLVERYEPEEQEAWAAQKGRFADVTSGLARVESNFSM
jgi:sugar (pentulose or hexulose) kinase